MREDTLAKRQVWEGGSPQHTPLPQPAPSIRLPKGACKPLGCSDGVKDTPGAGTEANGMERKPVISDYFSRTLREQPAGPHTDTSRHRPVKTSVGETTSCSKSPSLSVWAATAFSSPGETPCRSCIRCWCHRTVLHISNEMHHNVFGVFLLTTAPTILSCASLIYLSSCVSGAYCWFMFSPCPALKDGDWSQQISTLVFDREAVLLQ